MPRTKLDAENGTKQKKLAILIAGSAALSGTGLGRSVARAIGATEQTGLKKAKDPGKLTVNELVSISKGMHIEADEIRAAIKF